VARKLQLGLVALAIITLASFGAYFYATSIPGNSGFNQTGSCQTNVTAAPAADWTTYHGDNTRSGYAGPTSVSCAAPGWKSQPLDGTIYAEPLAFQGKIFVATENDSVYALNERTGALVWRTHLGQPVPRSALPCGDIDPTGITGTPVIDPATKTIYAVAFEVPGSHYLVALNTDDGTTRFSRSADPPGSDPLVQQQRAALSLGNGRVYIPFGGLFGDCGQYHGWVAGIRADGSGDMASYQVPTGREGGIWAPSGAALDSYGNLFVASGNGASSSIFDHGNSVIELSPELKELGYFAPSNWAQLNRGDADLGSVGPTFVGSGTIFQIGKEGIGYLLSSTNLGGIGGQQYSAKVCSSAYGGDAVAGGTVFVPCSNGLVALGLSPAAFTVSWRGPSFPAGPPIVTGNVVWTTDTSSGTLYGFDAMSGTELYSFSVGHVTRFTTPLSGGGQLIIGAGDVVLSFGLG
jgi:outer membrane protein assembly factor BamB